jgi:hypothetical protein
MFCIGPALAALHGRCPRTDKFCVLHCKDTRQDLKVNKGYILTHLISCTNISADARLARAAKKPLPHLAVGVLSSPCKGNK